MGFHYFVQVWQRFDLKESERKDNKSRKDNLRIHFEKENKSLQKLLKLKSIEQTNAEYTKMLDEQSFLCWQLKNVFPNEKNWISFCPIWNFRLFVSKLQKTRFFNESGHYERRWRFGA